MRTSALKQLAEKGVVTIQKKGDNWLVECALKKMKPNFWLTVKQRGGEN
jgi:hypothetical protein